MAPTDETEAEYPMLCASCDSPINEANAMEVPITERGVPIEGVSLLVCVGCFPNGAIERDWRMSESIEDATDD